MPNYSMTQAAAPRKAIGEFNVKEELKNKGIFSVTSRRNIGIHHDRENVNEPRAEFSIRGVQNSSENVYDPSSSSCHIKPGAVGMVLTAMMLLGSIRTSDGMENGRRPDPKVDSLSPYLEVRDDRHFSGCSSMKLNQKEILTAKHCVSMNGFKSYIKDSKGIFQEASSTIKHQKYDLAILRFPRDIQGNNVCMPLMRNSTFEATKANPKACGLKGNTLLLGVGLFNKDSADNPRKELRSGLFSIASNAPLEGLQLYDLVPDPIEGPSAKTRPGDSGGPVVVCNTVTGKFELAGIIKGSKGSTSQALVTSIVDFNTHSWLTTHSSPCTGVPVLGVDIYPSNEHTKHNLPHPRTCVQKKVIGKMHPNPRIVQSTGFLEVTNLCRKTVDLSLKAQCGHSEINAKMKPGEKLEFPQRRCTETKGLRLTTIYEE